MTENYFSFSAALGVLGSVAIIIIAVVALFNKKRKYPYLESNGTETIYAFFAIISGILASGDQLLIKCFLFSILAGLFQPILADPHLLKKTLRFAGEKGDKKTPIWMTFLWITVFTQLTYFGARLDSLFNYFGYSPTVLLKSITFFTIGLAYFYAFEWLIGNHLKWWTRRNCSQPFGVATYAVLSEAVAVVILGITSYFIADMPYFGVIMLACLAGVIISQTFIYYCELLYKPKEL